MRFIHPVGIQYGTESKKFHSFIHLPDSFIPSEIHTHVPERIADFLALGHARVVGPGLAVERGGGEEDAGVIDAEVVAAAAVHADQVERRRKQLRGKTNADHTHAGVWGRRGVGGRREEGRKRGVGGEWGGER